jgi:hypothetical protein
VWRIVCGDAPMKRILSVAVALTVCLLLLAVSSFFYPWHASFGDERFVCASWWADVATYDARLDVTICTRRKHPGGPLPCSIFSFPVFSMKGFPGILSFGGTTSVDPLGSTHWLRLHFNILVLVAFLPAAFFMLWLVRRRWLGVAHAGHCRHCAYDLTGNESGVCPECGAPT